MDAMDTKERTMNEQLQSAYDRAKAEDIFERCGRHIQPFTNVRFTCPACGLNIEYKVYDRALRSAATKCMCGKRLTVRTHGTPA